jgi:hypothetical protein
MILPGLNLRLSQTEAVQKGLSIEPVMLLKTSRMVDFVS